MRSAPNVQDIVGIRTVKSRLEKRAHHRVLFYHFIIPSLFQIRIVWPYVSPSIAIWMVYVERNGVMSVDAFPTYFWQVEVESLLDPAVFSRRILVPIACRLVSKRSNVEWAWTSQTKEKRSPTDQRFYLRKWSSIFYLCIFPRACKIRYLSNCVRGRDLRGWWCLLQRLAASSPDNCCFRAIACSIGFPHVRGSPLFNTVLVSALFISFLFSATGVGAVMDLVVSIAKARFAFLYIAKLLSSVVQSHYYSFECGEGFFFRRRWFRFRDLVVPIFIDSSCSIL